MELTAYKRDLDSVEDGKWFDFGDNARIKIARWNNNDHRAFLRRIYKANKRQLDANMLDDEDAKRLMVDQWPTIIRDWDGITEGGKELPYSPKIVVDLATNPQYEGFFDIIRDIAESEDNYRAETMEDVGND